MNEQEPRRIQIPEVKVNLSPERLEAIRIRFGQVSDIITSLKPARYTVSRNKNIKKG